MEYEQLLTIQGYAKIILTTIIFIVFFSWVYSIYKRDKTGETNYEKYSKLVLDDDINSTPLESIKKDNSKKEKLV